MKKLILVYISLFVSVFTAQLNAQSTQTNANITPNTALTNCDPNAGSISIQGGLTANTNASGFSFIPPTAGVISDCPTTVPSGQPAQYFPTTVLGADANASVTLKQSDFLTAIGACSKQITGTAILCLYQDNAFKSRAVLKYDTSPNMLSIDPGSISAGNDRISFTITDSKNLNDYLVCHGETEQTLKDTTDCGGEGIKKDTFKSTSITLGGLKNGTPYYFKARASAGGPFSDVRSGTPVQTDGFGRAYDGEPSPVSWSCAQTSAAPGTWGLFLLLLVFLFSRSLKSKALLLVIVATPVFADFVSVGITGTPYRPNLNNSTKADGTKTYGFYKCLFEDRMAPLMGVDVDFHLLDQFGSLQLGLGTAYTYAGGQAVLAANKDTCARSSDSVGLHMLHIRPQLTYVLNPWVDIFPLVPYVRVGLVSVGYMFQYQGGLDKESNVQKPLGFVFGWEAAAGLMLSMNFLEPRVASAARGVGVYSQIYLKTELAYMPINNFGSKGLDFSPAWPKDDLPLMLTFGLVFEI